jgi:hypothetical protein
MSTNKYRKGVHTAVFIVTLLVAALGQPCQAQDAATGPQLSVKWLRKVQSKVAGLNRQLSAESVSYLQKMADREMQMERQLATVNPQAAKQLFAGTAQQYRALQQQLRTDSGRQGQGFTGAYPAYLDSLKGLMGFLGQHPENLSQRAAPKIQAVSDELQALQAKMNDADIAKAFVQQRHEFLSRYLSQNPAIGKMLTQPLAGMQKEIYYYGQELRQYKEMWMNPDHLEQQALTLLNKLPSFQSFMKANSMLGGLFHLPATYSSPQALSGLQTKDQVAAVVKGQLGTSGGADAALQGNLQSAEAQLNDYKNKLGQLGTGNGDMKMPDFRPNDQKTKTFWKRLEYGANFQTTRNNYYFPMVTDFGASIAYKLGHDNLVGVGASYKLGWGNGIQHISFTNEGVGLRSFLQIRIKGSFSATGGFEYNYATPFTSYQQLKQIEYWTKSALIGVTKTISTKSTVFKKTSVSLLWDFLSYQQVPHTQPFLFRIGYNF